MSAVENPEEGLDADERIAIVDELTNEVVGSARRAEMVRDNKLEEWNTCPVVVVVRRVIRTLTRMLEVASHASTLFCPTLLELRILSTPNLVHEYNIISLYSRQNETALYDVIV